ncbi:MAG: hypothetical protein DRJ14_00395 [Acidobacteria bacterium]|nr:MAG: hypothetical protein DRJ14_00395 [Acidobacteriota bacterium]
MGEGQIEAPVGYTKLKGDASSRSYFRGRGHILVKYPADSGESFDNYLFWTERYLRAGIPVPKILRYDKKRMEMQLEDWGDTDGVTWFHQLSRPDERTAFVRCVYEYIPLIQGLSAYEPDQKRINLKWELDFFLKHARDTIFNNLDIAWLEFLCREIIHVLENGRWVLSHRDYHFRNVLVKNGGGCIIDFQDTRLAPEFYDIVSLLFDNYLDLKGIAAGIEPELDAPELRWAALQRNLKALGTFAWFGYKQGKDWFRESVPLAMRHVLSHLNALGLEAEAEKWQKLMESSLFPDQKQE